MSSLNTQCFEIVSPNDVMTSILLSLETEEDGICKISKQNLEEIANELWTTRLRYKKILKTAR